MALNRSGGGGVAPKAYSPVGTGTAADPNSILTSYTTSGLFTRMTLTNETVVSLLPNQGAYFETAIYDVYSVVSTMVPRDVFQIRIWLEDALLPADTCVWAAITDATMGSNVQGFGVRIDGNDSANRVSHLFCTVAGGWSDAVATNYNANVRGVGGNFFVGAYSTVPRGNSFAIDSSGAALSTANTSSSPTSTSGWTVGLETTKFSFGAGWTSGIGGAAGSVVKFSPRLFVLKPSSSNLLL